MVLVNMPVGGSQKNVDRTGDMFAWACALGPATCLLTALTSHDCVHDTAVS